MSGETRSVVVRLTAETAQYIAQMQSAGRLSTNAMKPAEAAVMRQSAAIDDLGGKAGKLGLAAAGGLALMAKAAMDWESQWAGVSKTVTGTSQELNTLEGDLRGLATSMPATHKEIAATAEAAGQLGVATGDVTDFTKVMVEMGETTDLASQDAATSIAQFMNVMQTVPDQVDEIGNTIVALGNKGASTESQITDMAQRVAGAGATIGASETDVLGLSAAMANLGIQSELGGGAVQRVLLGINTQVASGGDKLERYADVAGTSADDFARAWRESPVDAFDLLIQGLGKIQDSGGDVASVLADMDIKGTQNLQVMLRLAGSGDMLSRSLDQSADAWESNNALTKEYGKRAETTASQVQVAWNQIKDAAITGGAATLPVIADIASGVGTIADAYGDLPAPIHDITAGALALTAILGGGLWFGAKVVAGVTSTKASLAALRPEISRVGSSLATRSGVRQFTTDLGIMAATSRTAGATTARELDRTQAAAQRLRGQLGTSAFRGGALLAGLTLATTDLADGMGLSNTASYALMGTIAGPWGTAIGGGIGLIKDFRAASKDAAGAIDGFNDSLDDTDTTKMVAGFQALQSSARGTQADFDDVSGAADLVGDSFTNALDVLGGTGRGEKNAALDVATDQMSNLTGVLQGVAQANGDFIASASNGWQNLPYGDLEDLARIGTKVQPILKDLGYTLDDLMAMKPGSAESVEAVQEINDALAHADSHEGRVEALGDAIGGLGDNMDSTADQAKSLGDALDALLDPGMDLSAATDEWTTALRHLSDDLAKDKDGVALHTQTLKGNSDAAITNRAAIRDRVDSMKGLLTAEANAGASSEQLSRKMRTQRKALLDAGEAAGISRRDMRDYIDTIGLTPDLIRTIIQADTGQALSAMDAVKAMLDRLDGTRALTVVETVYQQTNKPKSLPGSPGGSADGSTVPDDGGTYADRFLYLLAPREEVISNRRKQADNFRPELKDINAGLTREEVFNRMLTRGLADGGTVGSIGRLAGGGTTGAASLEDRLAIAQAMQTIRDLRRDLAATVKKGDHKGEHQVRGLDRRIMDLQLQAAREDLKSAKTREAREARETAREAKKAIGDAKQGLNLLSGLPTPALSAGDQAANDTRKALADFRQQVREAGGTLGKNFGALTSQAVGLAKQYADNAASLDALNAKIEETKAAHADLTSAVTGSLKSDIWAPSKSPNLPGWLAGSQTADPLATLSADVANAEKHQELSAALTARGLSGDAFADAASKGGLKGLELLSSYSDEQLAQYSSLYQQRETETTKAGVYVGDQRYGAELAAQTAAAKQMAAEQAATAQRMTEMTELIRAQANAPERTGVVVGQVINATATAVSQGKTTQPKVTGRR